MTDHREIQDLRNVADHLSSLERLVEQAEADTGEFRRLFGLAENVRRLADRLEAKLDMARKMVADNP